MANLKENLNQNKYLSKKKMKNLVKFPMSGMIWLLQSRTIQRPYHQSKIKTLTNQTHPMETPTMLIHKTLVILKIQISQTST